MKKANANKIIQFLQQRWGNAACPFCGRNEWNVSEKIFELREFNDGNLMIGGPKGAVMPVIPITCANCGNTAFINALNTGLLEEERYDDRR
jgi:predicted nucleic-acid-binding Zn-ribbon protein